jgi:hypothetical protein
MKTHKHVLISLLAVALLGAMALRVNAKTGTPGIDQRQAKQSERIAKGEASERLSSQEAARIHASASLGRPRSTRTRPSRLPSLFQSTRSPR